MLEIGGFSVATILHFMIAIPLCGHILLTKESESVAIGWIALVLLSPYIGSGLYWLFGINRIARVARRMRKGGQYPAMPRISDAPTFAPNDRSEQNREIFQFANAVHDAPFLSGNRVEPLINGDATYPAMLAAIDTATESVALSVYIFDHDQAGLQFVTALLAARQRGVGVRVLLDDIGLRYSSRPIDRNLRRGGVATARFIPRRLKYLPFLNLRNHRKLMVVDGRVGFIGGMNIRQGNVLSANPSRPVQDIHFRVIGPVVDQLTALFEEDWLFAAGEDIRLPTWQPQEGENGLVLARLVPDGPDNYFEKLQWVILGALAFSRKSVCVMTPYFLPNDVIASALMVAALRGVEVEVIVPQKLDTPFINWAMTAKFRRLLEHGVKIYRGALPFEHSKILVVDGLWSLVGSTNWDQRSLRLNFEANMECHDPALGAELNAYFSKKKERSVPVDLSRLKETPLLVRLRNNIVRLLSPYL
jgi:cardiolipin synthase A/B